MRDCVRGGGNALPLQASPLVDRRLIAKRGIILAVAATRIDAADFQANDAVTTSSSIIKHL
jgi:hypothetical protein